MCQTLVLSLYCFSQMSFIFGNKQPAFITCHQPYQGVQNKQFSVDPGAPLSYSLAVELHWMWVGVACCLSLKTHWSQMATAVLLGAPPEKLENKFTVVLFFSVSNFQLKKGGSAINQPRCWCKYPWTPSTSVFLFPLSSTALFFSLFLCPLHLFVLQILWRDRNSLKVFIA